MSFKVGICGIGRIANDDHIPMIKRTRGFDLIAAYDGENTILVVNEIGDKNKAKQFGVVKLLKNRVVDFVEKPANPASSLVATAICILPPRIFPILTHYCFQERRDNIGSFIAHLVKEDKVLAYTYTGLWLDIGSEIRIG